MHRSGRCRIQPGDNVLQVVDMRATIVGHDNFAIERDHFCLPAHVEARLTRSVLPAERRRAVGSRTSTQCFISAAQVSFAVHTSCGAPPSAD